ncbi:MAG: metallophosphoesterase [Bacteroidales bacterium]|nr:metallophosphoesterase [Bacteroidales bacterium]
MDNVFRKGAWGRVALAYVVGIVILFVFMRLELPRYVSMLQLLILIFALDAVGFCFWRSWVRGVKSAWLRVLGYALHLLPFVLLMAFFIGLTQRNISLWPAFWRTYSLGVVLTLLSLHFVRAIVYLLWTAVYGLGRWTGAAWTDRWWAWRHKAAMGLSGLALAVMLYGMLYGAFDLQVDRVNLHQGGRAERGLDVSGPAGLAEAERLAVARIPTGLRGYRIVQITDFHIGSFVGTTFVEKVAQAILDLQPDMIVFTGDIVNFGSAELLPHMATLSRLQATDGVYAVLGNHDYGDYVDWESEEAKAANRQLLKDTYAAMGWRQLDNGSLWITRGRDSLRLVGVENWGGGYRFPKHGDLTAALAETACAIDTAAARPDFCRAGFPHVYTVLLSHDPTHFDSIVCREAPQIDLCLSGHTHGMQLGVRLGGKDYTAAHRVYRHDAGLYTQPNGQRLYVNTGVGFNGAPFRVGIRPRIVLLEL